MTHPAPEFATLQPKELLNRLALEEDRAPLELIEACVAHGEAMVEVLRGAIDDQYTWSDESPDLWWVPLHAAFILGRIPTESAGLLLVHLMRSLDKHDEVDLQDWVAGDWPALFANKPPDVIEAVRELAEDRSLDWYMRCQGGDVALDAGLRQGGQALEDAVDWAAALTRDESDEWPFRMSAASDLLDFPRPRHRAWLETMARDEERHQAVFGDPVGMFAVDDVESAFARASDEPDWFRRGDPWKFYSPEEIAARQQRWREEDESLESLDPDWDTSRPYIRPTPKVGRNDPCPCGSGKKYKRCCLARDEATTNESLAQTWQ